MHGVALSGALSWAAERELAAAGGPTCDRRAGRWTCSARRMVPCTLTAEVERGSADLPGRRHPDPGGRAGRAGTATFLRPRPAPTARSGRRPNDPHRRPPTSCRRRRPSRARRTSPRRRAGRRTSSSTRTATARATWSTAVPILPDEPLTGFQAAAATADGASMVTNWGSRACSTSTPTSPSRSRAADGIEIGLLATDRVENDGIAVGTASVFDRSGPLGTVVVAALANARRTVDLGSVSYTDDGRRQRG